MIDFQYTSADNDIHRVSASESGDTMTKLSVRQMDYRTDGQPPTVVAFPAVRFSMRWPAWHVWLVIGDETGSARQIHQMEEGQENRWSLTVRLRPGVYRYRYYAQHGTATMHVRPDEAEELPLQMDGLDALLTVSA